MGEGGETHSSITGNIMDYYVYFKGNTIGAVDEFTAVKAPVW